MLDLFLLYIKILFKYTLIAQPQRFLKFHQIIIYKPMKVWIIERRVARLDDTVQSNWVSQSSMIADQAYKISNLA